MTEVRVTPEIPVVGRPLNRSERRRAGARGQGLTLEGWLGQPMRRVEVLQEIEEFRKLILDEYRTLVLRQTILEATLLEQGVVTKAHLQAVLARAQAAITAQQTQTPEATHGVGPDGPSAPDEGNVHTQGEAV